MPLDVHFMQAVETLYVPRMGTDSMAQLLYTLIRLQRCRTVLEVGMGYTSPFIAQALMDNRSDYQREKSELLIKTKRYAETIGLRAPDDDQPLGQEVPYDRLAQLTSVSQAAKTRMDWVYSTPALLRPGYYLDDYEPKAYFVDTMEPAASSARDAMAAIEKLGLSSISSLWIGDFWSVECPLINDSSRFDLIWIDSPLTVTNAISLIRGAHWSALSPDGGLLIIHCLLTTKGGQLLVNEIFRREQRDDFGRLELLCLVEPHRILQNNCLIIRKTSGVSYDHVDEMLRASGESSLETEARDLAMGHA